MTIHPFSRRLGPLAGVALAFSLAGTASAQNVDGAIFTTTQSGTVVNENTRYEAKSDVYLNGGPQNHHANGLPDGHYYFMVTDPSGAVLLSTDDVACREVVVAGGRFAGAAGSCPHPTGAFDAANGSTSVQLAPFLDTPNQGGEYKAWITPVGEYGGDCKSQTRFGFCDSHSKTDNFKIREGSRAADVTVCKFNDLDGNGSQDAGEPMIPHWPITATGVDGGTVNTQTGDDGCVTVTYSGGDATHAVTLSEGTFGPDWTRTAPADGAYGDFTASAGVISIDVKPGDELTAPNFGNTNPFCGADCSTNSLVVSKTAYPSLKRTFVWGIEKKADQTEIKMAAGGEATVNYTVTVTHDAGTDSGWAVTGKIRVSNPGPAMSGVDVTDTVDDGGNCVVDAGAGLTIPGGSHIELDYTCSYDSLPAPGTSTATATSSAGVFSGAASVDFASATAAITDGSVDVTDTIAGSLGAVLATDPSPKEFTYSKTLTAPAGTCETTDNTATFKAASETTGSASRSVSVCGALDLSVSKTASATFATAVDKSVDRSLVQQQGGSATFNYTVLVTTSGWKVTGNVTVSNPNDWQGISASITDNVGSGGACTVTGGESVVVGAKGTVSVPYVCTYASAPGALAGVNTATATWDQTASFTPSAAASGTAAYDFGSMTVTDAFNGGAAQVLGVVAGNAPLTKFTESRTIANASGGQCRVVANVASIASAGKSDVQNVTLCNTATGALTMGFWQNKNGQGIIKSGASIGGVCASGLWLRQYAPFQDMSGTATCSDVASYATSLIKAANASGTSMNAMLKAQMLSTALDVFFSDAALGGNAIGAATSVGGVSIDLTNVNKPIGSAIFENTTGAFGGSSLTVSQLLAIASSQSSSGGGFWYGNVKALQELAKDTFDAINNQVAWIGQ